MTTGTGSPAPTTSPASLLREVGRTVVGALAVVLEAGRLLVAHWPVLLVVLLLGASARELALWGSFELSRLSPVAATVTVALAPLASVVALVLALRVVMPSMAHVPDQSALPRSRQLAVVGSALVPFLAVYAAQGFLTKDARRFVNEVYADEFRSTNWFVGETVDARTWDGAPWVVTVTVVVLALVLRWGLDRYALPARHWGFGLLAGWVEALWLLTVARTLTTGWGGIWAWVGERQGVAWMLEGYAWVLARLGPLGGAVDGAVGWALGILGELDTLVVVPLAWLTVGAVVYGRELERAQAPGLGEVHRRVVDAVDDRARLRLEAAARRARRARERALRVRSATDRLPEWLRSWVLGPVTSVTDRFSSLGTGLLTLMRAGLVPMVTLCLVLVAGRHAGALVGSGLRAVLGPMETGWAVVLAPAIDLGLTLVNTLIIVVLVAAAVDRFLARPAAD